MPEGIILIVEDNNVLREGLREMLNYEGFTVVTARDGQDALDRMSALTPDLILSDIAMPRIDGFAFFNAVRERPEWVTIPFIFLTARTDPADILTAKNLGAEDYLTKPISRDELVSIIHSRMNRMRQVKVAQLRQAYQASLTALANAIDRRDNLTGGHVERVNKYALILAKHLGWSERRQEQLSFAAILHDIGKIHISQNILFAPHKLTENEWEIIRQHPITGTEMIKDIPLLTEVIPIVRHHHECWDGTGYPDGLSGKEIPEGARILAIVDAFDAMTNQRPYSPARSPEEAYQEILRLSGSNYDPNVVAAFQKAWETGQIQSIFTS